MHLKTTLAVAVGAGGFVSMLIGQAPTEKIRAVSYTPNGNPLSGPDQVVIEQDQSLAI